ANADSLGVTGTFTGNLRAYYGAERLKAFLETQLKNTEYDRTEDATVSTLLVSIGLEARIVGNLGVVASTGVENFLSVDDPYSALRANLDLRFYFR
ncbi:MAG TPA: hypothetical protein VHL57_12635, partial [Flavobacteriales bacterium]|nr:hypothetical protein [Flavobacteriales bacterium]